MGLIAAGISSAVITPLGVSLCSGRSVWLGDEQKDKRFFWTNIAVVVAGISLATALSFGRLAGKNAAAAV